MKEENVAGPSYRF